MQKFPNIFQNLRKNENLGKYLNFGCGGSAELLFRPETLEELQEFMKSRDRSQKITVLGGGTNMLVRDGGVDGVTILTRGLNRIALVDGNIVAESGVANARLFSFAKNLGIRGFEFLGCLAGTVGGACAMNAGCYGSEIKDVLVSLEVLDFDGRVHSLSVADCSMGYRKNNLPKNLVFSRATFRADRSGDRKELEEIFRKMLTEKLRTQPLDEKTCGCTFKNPPDIPAWRVIKDLGLQGVDLGGARFSEKHANFLVNHAGATATDLENLIDLARSRAREEMKVNLELEIEVVGNASQ
ncbi:MAG: UDP-N-acetylmuramate dehydrogenase [Rickettsiales bacterium]|jgi:UDP-N-acetylmuramate dehydrogenase|nr:UDP-N-acetylmuramate dehydrogenase [Rickettsiales bacterium]